MGFLDGNVARMIVTHDARTFNESEHPATGKNVLGESLNKLFLRQLCPSGVGARRWGKYVQMPFKLLLLLRVKCCPSLLQTANKNHRSSKA